MTNNKIAKKLNILIVDDDMAICQSLQLLLQDIAEVNCFYNIGAAREYLNENKDSVEFVIIDYQVSSEDGIDFFRKEVVQKNLKIPGILISGFIVTKLKTPEELDILNSLFLKIFEKPFDFIQLRSFIQNEVINKN